MATLDQTSILGNLRGAWAGGVISSNNSAWYLRTWRTPLTPATRYQREARAILSTCATLWNTLPSTTKAEWIEAATLPEWQKNDWFGNPKNPTGFGLFVRLNQPLLLAEIAPITTPPEPTFPTCPNIESAWIIRNESTAYGRADLTEALPSTAQNVIAWITPGTALGTQPAKTKRRLDYIHANHTLTYVPLWQRAILQYGLPYVDQTWSIYIFCFDNSGRQSQPVSTTITVSAA